ncbi:MULTISPECIES: ROK family transcriptional regulator [unclassified Roseitalea]|uniref:ROK family transcriptional regulator n=1 Tax=unclassified Roseitalea TaxID=2639107 RepID=UPI00273D18E1|nr:MULTISPECIES: ROK family transcriptional regulator [unclassified Roseitalea]
MRIQAEAIAIDTLEQPNGCGPLTPPLSSSVKPLRQQVFEAIRAAGSIARVDVARTVGISPGSVTALTSELIDAGLIGESGASQRETEAARGRPPVALRVRPEARFVAGIKLSSPTHSAVIVDFAGNRLSQASAPRAFARHSSADTIAEAVRMLDSALEKSGLDRADLAAVGLGIPGFVDTGTGRVSWSPIMADREVPLQAMVAERLGLNVCIDNDANLLTMAELWFGAGRALADFAVVTIEHGVGMGLVVNHEIYRGGGGMGMELGHTKVHLDGALCRCGQRGCLEAYVADYALVREASTALNWPDGTREPHIVLESLFSQAKAGNAAARSIFHRAGRYLALGIANVVTMFDPGLIILSGARMRYDYLYAREVMTEIASLSSAAHRAGPRVETHAWGDMVWAQGAAALALAAVTDATLGAQGTGR